MPTLQALNQLLDHERRTRDDAVLGLRDADAACGRADAQALQLGAYRNEYVERWSARFRAPGSVALMQCYQGFMARLDQAIVQQQAAVLAAHKRLEQARLTLREFERRVASVEKLIERRRLQMQRQHARREQSLTDETAQRMHTQRLAHRHDGGEPPR
jgi:flagellar protein FliJ